MDKDKEIPAAPPCCTPSPASGEPPDKNCYTLPDGDCVGGLLAGDKPCMHDVLPEDAEYTVVSRAKLEAVKEAGVKLADAIDDVPRPHLLDNDYGHHKRMREKAKAFRAAMKGLEDIKDGKA
jgi:hypothetical protein